MGLFAINWPLSSLCCRLEANGMGTDTWRAAACASGSICLAIEDNEWGPFLGTL